MLKCGCFIPSNIPQKIELHSLLCNYLLLTIIRVLLLLFWVMSIRLHYILWLNKMLKRCQDLAEFLFVIELFYVFFWSTDLFICLVMVVLYWDFNALINLVLTFVNVVVK